MFKRIIHAARFAKTLQRVNMGLARAAAVGALRTIDPTWPPSWEFSGFSQNGEDGILDYLCTKVIRPNYYFVEIGAADGLENNTAWLAIAKKYSGLMIEGNKTLSLRQNQTIPAFNLGVHCLPCFVTQDNVDDIIKDMLYLDPDVFSIDIDGNDYHILKLFLQKGIRPKIVVVEYNSAFGPEASITIPYQAYFNYQSAHPSALYYGVSMMGWKKWLESCGYQFVTVETHGVNAFFVDAQAVEEKWLQSIRPVHFAENFYQYKKFRSSWEKQFEQIKHLHFEVVSA